MSGVAPHTVKRHRSQDRLSDSGVAEALNVTTNGASDRAAGKCSDDHSIEGHITATDTNWPDPCRCVIANLQAIVSPYRWRPNSYRQRRWRHSWWGRDVANVTAPPSIPAPLVPIASRVSVPDEVRTGAMLSLSMLVTETLHPD